ncbi:MAG: hypothetical protein V4598_05765 [Bdellovibrionota bacterium]
MKNLSRFLAVVLTVSTLTVSKPSHSAVSLVTFNAPLALMSLGMLAGSGVVAIISSKFEHDNSDILATGAVFGYIGSAIVAAVGIVTLDGEGGQKIAFAELSQKQAKILGVSSEEKRIFNSELDMANQVFAQVTSELDRMEKPKAQDAKALWEQYESMLSAETVSVMKKISQSSAK